MALPAIAYGWLLHTLWRSTRSTPLVLTAAVTLTAVAGIAAVGNTLSFSAVTVSVGVLAGLATARALRDDLPDEPPSGTAA
ncbi:hypothetical protein [Streptomyces cavernicola]|uniref:hypothetical protein n=1 Tax=Streptomyces cavernicola TaxID=3043613 RepID=UPI0032B7E899